MMSEADPQSAAATGIHPLDRAIWNALTTTQSRFAVRDERAVRYPAAIAPFAALADSGAESFASLRLLIEAHGPAAFMEKADVVAPPAFAVVRRAPLLQMIWQYTDTVQQNELQYARLTERDMPEMLALTHATQPGPFGPRTPELGSYFGVRKDGRLVAMAGERMRLDGFTEISAVCVDPAFRGQGYARGLMLLLISVISTRGETPFLHAFTANEKAIDLYRTLGFVDRQVFRLTVLDRA
jgi:predicted GNAT family acetyltransferase